jgi:hypothetical protein
MAEELSKNFETLQLHAGKERDGFGLGGLLMSGQVIHRILRRILERCRFMRLLYAPKFGEVPRKDE